jgi:hypothetical protein
MKPGGNRAPSSAPFFTFLPLWAQTSLGYLGPQPAEFHKPFSSQPTHCTDCKQKPWEGKELTKVTEWVSDQAEALIILTQGSHSLSSTTSPHHSAKKITPARDKHVERMLLSGFFKECFSLDSEGSRQVLGKCIHANEHTCVTN